MSSRLDRVQDWEALGKAAHFRIAEMAALGGVSVRTVERYFSVLTARLTNCLLVELTLTGPYSGANNNSASSASAVFQTVGAGAHYLAKNSSWRNSGTTNIDATLLAELRKPTTYPPLVLSNDVTLNTTLTPQAQRDTDATDGGYHYDPIDYLVFN